MTWVGDLQITVTIEICVNEKTHVDQNGLTTGSLFNHLIHICLCFTFILKLERCVQKIQIIEINNCIGLESLGQEYKKKSTLKQRSH